MYNSFNIFERGACASSLSRARPKKKNSQVFVGFLSNNSLAITSPYRMELNRNFADIKNLSSLL